ncbi:MAG: nuclear transport factor 2 family protein [Vicinamibacterales bacterium]
MRVVAGVVTVCALVAGWCAWTSDERAIRSRLTELAAAASSAPADTDLSTVTRAATLARGLTPDVRVSFGAGAPEVNGRDAVSALASQIGRTQGSLEIELSGIDVSIGPDGREAEAVTVVRVRGGQAADRRFDGQEVRFALTRTDGTWLVGRIEPVQVLAKP